MTTTQAALLEALKAVEPYLDSIVCYASTMAEHPPNALPAKVRAAIAQAEAAALRAADAAQAGERAWLVELSIPSHAPQWWGFNHSPRSRGEWCADSNSAVRFARRLDAERMRLHIIAAFGFTGQHSYERSVSVTEHEWGSAAAQADDAAVDQFAAMLKVKLAKARAKGRSGWRDPAWPASDINRQMHEHAVKGDPLDVAAYAMFLALRGESSVAAQAGPALVPLTDEQIDALRGLDTASRVRFYEHDFYVLSNFSAFNLRWKGRAYPTSEHAYHAEKFGHSAETVELFDLMRDMPSAHEAFKLAERNKHLRRPDWDVVKVGIMLDILRAKAQQHEYVRRKLLDTGDRELVEDSWRDDFWGWGPNRDGKNMLGRLWMQVRAELRDGAIAAAPQAPAEQPPWPSDHCEGSLCMQTNRCSYAPCQSREHAKVAPAEPAAQAVRWQGGLTNDELRAAFQSKLQPGAKFTDDDLTAFALGIEWAEARAAPPAASLR